MGETNKPKKTPIDGVIVVIVEESQLEGVMIPTLLEGDRVEDVEGGVQEKPERKRHLSWALKDE